MNESAFGVFVTFVVAVILMVAAGIFFMPGHDIIIEGLNDIYQNFSSARVDMGL